MNRTLWCNPCFSPDGEFIAAGGTGHLQHTIYIWSIHGQLKQLLDGPPSVLVDLSWHPSRAIIVSVSTDGVVHVWAKEYSHAWAAFAPNFSVLEENEEYEEREDEFDLVMLSSIIIFFFF